MEISLTLIYWYISVGALVGLVSNLVFGKRGVEMVHSIGIGILGSVLVGPVAQFFGFGSDNLVFALIGSICFLFIVNAFRNKATPQEIEVTG